MTAVKSTFPGGSRGKVNRAGSSIRDGTATPEDIAVINTWREAHRHVINSFQSILRNRTRSSNIVVAQRHKRQRTIFDKLTRFPRMQLSRMDDVAGCRLIFDSIETLERFRKEFHEKSRFNHKLRNHPGKYNYILNPKASGYRGIHDVYEYDVNSSSGRDRKGLLIELQYRTTRQHAWATAVELVGLLTAHQPKFDRGDEQVRHILRLASEIIARSFEDMPSSMPHLSSHSVVEQFNDLDARLTFMRMLRGLNKSNLHVPSKKNLILIFELHDEELTEVRSYTYTTDALRALFQLEQQNPGMDVVLVRSQEPKDVSEAFRNYFSDARQFIDLIDDGSKMLLNDRISIP